MTTIPWSQLVADGVVTDRQADELAEVIVRHESGAWTLNGYMNLHPRLQRKADRVVLWLCTPMEVAH